MLSLPVLLDHLPILPLCHQLQCTHPGHRLIVRDHLPDHLPIRQPCHQLHCTHLVHLLLLRVAMLCLLDMNRCPIIVQDLHLLDHLSTRRFSLLCTLPANHRTIQDLLDHQPTHRHSLLLQCIRLANPHLHLVDTLRLPVVTVHLPQLPCTFPVNLSSLILLRRVT